MTGSHVLRRTTYLLVGGAIALGFVVLTMAVLSMFVDDGAVLAPLMTLGIVPVVLVGALPGVRDLHVAGARTLLGVEGVVVPEPLRWEHRWRTCLWSLLHQAVGFLTALVILLALAAAAGVVMLVLDASTSVIGGLVDRPASPGGWASLTAAAAAFVLAAAWLVRLAGVAATWAAPVLLGPTGADRLALVEARLEREQSHLRLSRDLHDGVGHALSAISLQAEAGRRHLHGDVARTEAALSAIAGLAGTAVAELDHALRLLRDGPATREPEPGLERLDALVDEHRALGVDVRLTTGRCHDGRLPAVVSRTAYRVCAEGLANAAKHGTGVVRLDLARDGGLLHVVLRNDVRDTAAIGEGVGLVGLRERVGLLDGRLSAGLSGGAWVLDVGLPLRGLEGSGDA